MDGKKVVSQLICQFFCTQKNYVTIYTLKQSFIKLPKVIGSHLAENTLSGNLNPLQLRACGGKMGKLKMCTFKWI